jgi:hypothetical protein
MTGRIFATDKHSKRKFLIDTGSDLYVYPRKLIPRRRDRMNYDLCAANGTTIHTYGWMPPSLNLGLRRNFTWRFVVADVTRPIVGVDFLSHFGLLVDSRNNRLLDGVTSLSVPALAAIALIPSVKTIIGGTPIDSLLAEFPDLTRPAGVSAKSATTRSTTSGLLRAHRSPAHRGDWHRTGSQSPKPSSKPCCGMAQPNGPRAPGIRPYTSCPRRTTGGVPVATTEP